MPKIISLANISQFAATSLSDGGYLPGPQLIPNCALVRINWNLSDSKVGHNMLHVSWNGTPALSVALAETIRAGFVGGATWTTLAAQLIPSASLASVTLLDVRSQTGIELTSTGSAAPGTGTGNTLPDEVAAVITLRTANRGKSGRGRVYIPGWASVATLGTGTMTGAAVTALGAWFNTAVMPTLSSNIGPLVLALPHRRQYTSPVTGATFADRPATTLPVVTALVRNNTWDSQRRRGLK